MKESDKMLIAMGISGAITGAILDYQSQTKKPPEPVPVVETVKQPEQPPPPKPCLKDSTDKDKECK